ncbi:MAG: hypothetical protein HOW73_43475 [Polyangiaceae bacterium]|nr:hypothetical protein [Polyangiaceae bacterium]
MKVHSTQAEAHAANNAVVAAAQAAAAEHGVNIVISVAARFDGETTSICGVDTTPDLPAVAAVELAGLALGALCHVADDAAKSHVAELSEKAVVAGYDLAKRLLDRNDDRSDPPEKTPMQIARERGSRVGGPEKCPKSCGDCGNYDHHFSDAYAEDPHTKPDHPAAILGVEVWIGCKHCDAWIEYGVADLEPDDG